jgi:GTP-binding protein
MVGRSNVGKSTLINSLLNRRGVARVSQTPGKTQAIHFYLVNDRFYIVDLPGYGYAKVPRVIAASWGQLVRSYLESSETLRLLLLLVDSRRKPSGEDLQMRDWLDVEQIAWRVVSTKVDKLSKNEWSQQRRVIAATLGIDAESILPFTSTNRSGVESLWRDIGRELEIHH